MAGMLNVWKQTWKEKDPYNSQQGRVDEPYTSTSSVNVADAGYPSGTTSSHPSHLSNPRVKRSRTDPEPSDEPTHKRSKKRPSRSEYARFPEVDAALQGTIIERAKRENTIASLPLECSGAAGSIIVRYLVWAVQTEQSQRSPAISRYRTALLVADDSSAAYVRNRISTDTDASLRMDNYNESARISEAQPWTTLLQRDAVHVNPTLLLDSLKRGTLAITQIHTLIICHTQNLLDHESSIFTPIIRLMGDIYRITDNLSRPRTLGLVVVDSPGLLLSGSAMLSIQEVLDSKICDVSTETPNPLTIPCLPNKAIILYDKTVTPAGRILLQEVQQIDPSETVFRNIREASRNALAELGSCASDLIWRRAFKEIDVATQAGSEGVNVRKDSISARILQCNIRELVKDWSFTMPNLDTSSRGFNVTHKFLRLVEALECCKPYGEIFRGIIFIQNPTIAPVLIDLLRTLDLQLGFLRPYAFIGINGSESDQHQEETFRCFTTGTYNLLIAAESAEHRDIPKAPVVICFNLFNNQLSNARICACTSGRESALIYMVEQGNSAQRHVLSQNTRSDTNRLQLAEHNFDRYLGLSRSPPQEHFNKSENDDTLERFIQDPTTGRRIYIEDATDAVYRIASSKDPEPGSGLFEYEERNAEPDTLKTYTCTVALPGIYAVSGPPSISKSQARTAACYKACLDLAGAGLLDYRVYPSPKENVTLEDNKVDNDIQSGTRKYHRKEPDFWTNSKSPLTTSLYPMVISVTVTDDNAQPHSPLVILTRQPLPDLASFKLFFSGFPSLVSTKRGAVVQVDNARLQELYLYTIRMCRTISNKPYNCAKADMMYFLAPLTSAWGIRSDESTKDMPCSLPSITDSIPWDMVSLAGRTYAIPLTAATLEEAEEEIKDAIVQDRWVEFTRRYVAVKMRPDLTALSKPLDSPREASYNSLLDFCKARLKGFNGLKNYDQPLIEVSTAPTILNLLNPTSRPLAIPTLSHARYLVPELCAKFTISASTLRTALLIPSITRRIDDLLLVKEVNAKLFDQEISEDLLHMALCTPSSGVEYDYERLELLGDAFLKYLTTVYVYVAYPTWTEGALHSVRQLLISNKSLFQNARLIGLPAYIQSKPFAAKLWHPPNFTLLSLEAGNSGETTSTANDIERPESSPPESVEPRDPATTQKPKKKKRKSGDDIQWLGDKAIADVAEAVIGAAYITGGREMGLKITKALGVPIIDIGRWSDFALRTSSTPSKVISKLKPGSIEAVEAIIGYKFVHPHLLVQALTHSSTSGVNTTSYERLEFVGDAIIDLMVIRHLFYRNRQLTPGGLTLLKGAMVSNAALAAACVWSGLHEHLIHESYTLTKSIREYVMSLQASQEKEYKAAAFENRPPGQFWLGLEPPKVLSDVVESITGAIYISDNFSPVGVETMFENLLKPFYEKHITFKTLSHHPTKILFEVLQAQGCQRFKISKEKTADNKISCHVLVHDVILTSADDNIASVAARRASLIALDALEGDSGFLARTCNCRLNSQLTKEEKKEAKRMLKLVGEDGLDMLTVEDELTDGLHVGNESPDSELEEGMILE